MSGVVLVVCENFVYTDIEAEDGISLVYQFASYFLAIFNFAFCMLCPDLVK